MSHEPPDPFADDLRARLNGALQAESARRRELDEARAARDAMADELAITRAALANARAKALEEALEEATAAVERLAIWVDDDNGRRVGQRAAKAIRTLIAPPDPDSKPREPGCKCHLEEGNSPCPVHDRVEVVKFSPPASAEAPAARCRSTDAGPCHNSAMPGKPLCWQHGGDMVPDLAPAEKPTCATCHDTHRMTLNEREVMCTHCPTPCGLCSGGAYCKTTPCDCSCHAPAAKPEACATCGRPIGSKVIAACLDCPLDPPAVAKSEACPANPDGSHHAWHDDGPHTFCKCGKELP